MADLTNRTIFDEFPTPELAILVAMEQGFACSVDRDYATLVDHGYVAKSHGSTMVLRRVEVHYEWQQPL